MRLTKRECLIWYSVKSWLRANWLLVIAILIGGGVFVGAWLFNSNPDVESSRYMLSAMAQVIGTVFVLAVAVIQIIGGRKTIKLERLISQRYFQVTAIGSFLGIALPLTSLYFNWLYVDVVIALCLGLGITNLLMIGWFIVRITYAKDLVATEKITSANELQDKSLIDLKRRALESLSLRISSNAMEVITELLRRAKENLSMGREGEQIVRDACTVIRDIALDRGNTFPEVSEKAASSLIEINKDARKERRFGISEAVVIPYLRILGERLRVQEYPGWFEIKKHILECLAEDIRGGRIDFNEPVRPSDRLTPLQSLRILLKSVKNNKEQWEELKNLIIDEFVKSLKKGYLKEEHLCPIVGLTFNIIVEGASAQRVFERGGFSSAEVNRRLDDFYDKLISQLTRIADASSTSQKNLKKFLENKKDCVVNPAYSIIGHDRRGIEKRFDELMKRLEEN